MVSHCMIVGSVVVIEISFVAQIILSCGHSSTWQWHRPLFRPHKALQPSLFHFLHVLFQSETGSEGCC